MHDASKLARRRVTVTTRVSNCAAGAGTPDEEAAKMRHVHGHGCKTKAVQMKVSKRRIRRSHRRRARADGFPAAFEVQPQHQEAPRTVHKASWCREMQCVRNEMQSQDVMVAVARAFGTDLLHFIGVVQLQGRWQTHVHVCEVVDEVRCA